METTTIHHIIVMPSDLKEEKFTFFQGFPREIAFDYLKILSCLSWFPHDILETRLNTKSLMLSKAAGSSLDVNHVNENLLIDGHIDLTSLFTVFWSINGTIKKTNAAKNQFLIPPIVISCEKSPNSIYIDNVREDIVLSALEELRELAIKNYGNNELTAYLSKQPTEKKEKIEIPLETINHNCVYPLINTLISCGYYPSKVDQVDPSLNFQQHTDAIINAAACIDEKRKKLEDPYSWEKNSVIIYCPSIYNHLYKSNSNSWNTLYRKISKTEREFIKNGIIRNKGYSNSSIKIKDEAGFNPYETGGITKALLIDRQIELRLFSEIVSVLASNQFCPAIRLPHGVMLHHDRLKNISKLIVSFNPNNKKASRILNKKFKSYIEAVRTDIGHRLYEFSLLDRDEILAICDFPIEWLSLNGIPIMFTHEISRIFPTPGTMIGQAALRSQRVMVHYSTFTDICVIRSFDAADPIKNHLKFAINSFEMSGAYENLQINIIDVSSRENLIDTLNNFGGQIVIFDCHGDHGGEKGYGWLQIGNEKVNVWELSNTCRMPPIVILSACNTQPIDGSHASVANGFFRCGAISVLGTYASINSIHASVFIARLLLRISEYLPAVSKKGFVTWRYIITGFLRMSYVTDILNGFQNILRIINESQYRSIHSKANYLINFRYSNWEDKFIELLCYETKLTQEQISRILEEHFQFVETMLYSQLGRPENILIYNDKDE